jgi:hypothetical protein
LLASRPYGARFAKAAAVVALSLSAACTPARAPVAGDRQSQQKRRAPADADVAVWRGVFDSVRDTAPGFAYETVHQVITLTIGPGNKAQMVIDEQVTKSQRERGACRVGPQRRQMLCSYAKDDRYRCGYRFEGEALHGDGLVVALKGYSEGAGREVEIHCPTPASRNLACELRTRYWPRIAWMPVERPGPPQPGAVQVEEVEPLREWPEGVWSDPAFNGRFTFTPLAGTSEARTTEVASGCKNTGSSSRRWPPEATTPAPEPAGDPD